VPRWSQVHFILHVEHLLRSKWARQTAALFTLLFVMSVAALAQGSPFDSGLTAIQSLFTGTIAKVATLVAIVIGGYGTANPVRKRRSLVLPPGTDHFLRRRQAAHWP
jgi:hypothetical protein